MRRACCDSNFFTSSAIGRRIASLTAFFVISLNSTRWMFGFVLANLLGDVPGDRLPFAIGVGRQQHPSGNRRRRLDLRQHLLLRLDDDVFGPEAVLDVDAHLLAGQILDVTDRRLHDVAAAEVLLDRLRLRGRLDDHQRVVVARAHHRRRFADLRLGALGRLLDAVASGAALAAPALPTLRPCRPWRPSPTLATLARPWRPWRPWRACRPWPVSRPSRSPRPFRPCRAWRLPPS